RNTAGARAALRRSLQGVRHQFTTTGDQPAGPLCNALPSCCAWSAGRTPGLRRRRVQILYKGPEIPANTVIPEFALSLTYRRYEKAENPGSIPVWDSFEPDQSSRASRLLRVNRAVYA